MFNIFMIPFYMLRAFLLTILFETLLAFALGVRGKRNTAVIVLAQAVTNPPLVITLMIINLRCGFTFYCAAVAVLEFAALLTEGAIYKSVLDFKKINPFLLSLILNVFSFSAGQVINHFVK